MASLQPLTGSNEVLPTDLSRYPGARRCQICCARIAFRNREVCPACIQSAFNAGRLLQNVFLKDLSNSDTKFIALRNAFLARLAASSSVTTPGTAVQPAVIHRIIAVHNVEAAFRYYPQRFLELGVPLNGAQLQQAGILLNERRLFGATLPRVACDIMDAASPVHNSAQGAPTGELSPCSMVDCELCTIIRLGAQSSERGCHPIGCGRGVYLAYEPYQAADMPSVETITEPEATAAHTPGNARFHTTSVINRGRSGRVYGNKRAAVLYLAMLGKMDWTSQPHGHSLLESTDAAFQSLVVEVGHVPQVVVPDIRAVLPIYIYIFRCVNMI